MFFSRLIIPAERLLNAAGSRGEGKLKEHLGEYAE
jgi:hypothetical protein